jgi:hypothetical protein
VNSGVVGAANDLALIPKTFAGRPFGQEGAPLYGFDDIWFLEGVVASGSIETCEFSYREDMPLLNVDRSVIVSEQDPFPEFIAKWDPGWRGAIS